mgnify:CR=1 FL=1
MTLRDLTERVRSLLSGMRRHEELAASGQRAAAATPTPWRVLKVLHRGDEHASWYIQHGIATIAHMNGPCRLYENMDSDATFIAHARQDIIALLAHIDACARREAPPARETA